MAGIYRHRFFAPSPPWGAGNLLKCRVLLDVVCVLLVQLSVVRLAFPHPMLVLLYRTAELMLLPRSVPSPRWGAGDAGVISLSDYVMATTAMSAWRVRMGWVGPMWTGVPLPYDVLSGAVIWPRQ